MPTNPSQSETRELQHEIAALCPRLAISVREMSQLGMCSYETATLVRHLIRTIHTANDAKTYHNARLFSFSAIQLAQAIGTIRQDPQDDLYCAANWVAIAMDDFLAWRHMTGGHTPRQPHKYQAASWAAIQADSRLDRIFASVDAKRAQISKSGTLGDKTAQSATQGVARA